MTALADLKPREVIALRNAAIAEKRRAERIAGDPAMRADARERARRRAADLRRGQRVLNAELERIGADDAAERGR
jgi:hypothetical protein